ncbi:MAG TPA: hypothetical protein VFV80_02050 [Geminicoccaceae bacterium]|nr:hypothetical protein [Geminicoccaceae bacterium]
MRARICDCSKLIVGVSVVTSLLCGCGSIQLYNQARDQTAQAAKLDWEEAKIGEALEAEQRNLDFLLEQEKQLMARHTRALRDQEYFVLVTDADVSPRDWWLEGRIKERLSALGFAPDGNQPSASVRGRITAYLNRDIDVAAEEQGVDRARESLADLGVPVSSLGCELSGPSSSLDGLAASAVRDGTLAAGQSESWKQLREPLYAEYVAACSELNQARLAQPPALAGLADGEITTAYADWQEARAQLVRQQAAAREQTEAFNKAVQALEAAQSSPPADGPILVSACPPGGAATPAASTGSADAPAAGSDRIQDLVTNAQCWLQLLERTGAVGALDAVDGRLEELDKIFRAAAGEQLPELSRSRRRAAIVLAGAPALIDDFDELTASLNSVPMTALLIEKRRLEAMRIAAQGRVAAEQRRVRLYGDKLAAFDDELRAYNQIFAELAEVGERCRQNRALCDNVEDPLSVPVTAALRGRFNPDIKERLSFVLAMYGYSITSIRKRQEEIDYELIGLHYETGQDQAVAALGQWAGVIGPLVDQQAAYHASGIRPEELASLIFQALQAAGVIAIGVGVN